MTETRAMTDAPALYHLADPSDYGLACAAGEYRISTRGMTLDEVGFVHLSYAAQWPATRQRFYADVTTPLLLLTIDRPGSTCVPNPATPAPRNCSRTSTARCR